MPHPWATCVCFWLVFGMVSCRHISSSLYLFKINKCIILSIGYTFSSEKFPSLKINYYCLIYLIYYHRSEDLVEPQSSGFAKLCAYCIFATSTSNGHSNCKSTKGSQPLMETDVSRVFSHFVLPFFNKFLMP